MKKVIEKFKEALSKAKDELVAVAIKAKNKLRQVFGMIVEFFKENPFVFLVAASVILTITGKAIDHLEERKVRSKIWDPSMGYYVRTRRPLESDELLYMIRQRKENRVPYVESLEKMGLLK